MKDKWFEEIMELKKVGYIFKNVAQKVVLELESCFLLIYFEIIHNL